jgi:hypothetical protein
MPSIEVPIIRVECPMTKREHAPRTSKKLGNIGSPDQAAPAGPWTDEEMAAAKPLPLPTVNPPAEVSESGVPHAGKGKTKPGGRPEGK